MVLDLCTENNAICWFNLKTMSKLKDQTSLRWEQTSLYSKCHGRLESAGKDEVTFGDVLTSNMSSISYEVTFGDDIKYEQNFAAKKIIGRRDPNII